MNNQRPVERALVTLLPTHENELPSELLTLAQSLLAQSRSYSSSLKPEEEIARPFACAEIACRRLSRSLKLPPLLGHPPCPPRVYKKLYTFLERSIGGNAASSNRSTRATPNKPTSIPKKNGVDTTPSRTPSKQANQDTTPSKNTPLGKRTFNEGSHNKTLSRATSVKRARFTQESPKLLQNIKDAPQWVMPSIRSVCRILSTPAPRMSLWSRPPISRTLPPHIYAGVSSILHFVSSMTNKDISKLDEEISDFLSILRMPEEENTDDYKEVVMALIVAVYFLVLARRRSPSPGTAAINTNNVDAAAATSPGGRPPTSPSKEGEARKMDKKTFSEMRQTALSSLGLSSGDRRHAEDVDSWIALIMGQQWAKGQEWFDNIPMAGEREEEFGNESNPDGDDEGGDIRGSKRTNIFLHAGKDEEGLLLPGLGTMMQDRVDYLSENRREDYLEWKADMLQRISKMKKMANSNRGSSKAVATA